MNAPQSLGSSSPRPLHRRPAAVGLVACGGAAGAIARWLTTEALPDDSTSAGWAVFIVNVVGALILGALLEALTRAGEDVGVRQRLRLAVGTGFCGAFTTYSSFVSDVEGLTHHSVAHGWSWGLAEVICGLAAAGLGAFVSARFVTPSPAESGTTR